MVVKKTSSSKAGAVAGETAVAAVAGALDEGTRVFFTLSTTALRLIDTAALVDGLDRSGVIEQLVGVGLARYYAGKHADQAAASVER